MALGRPISPLVLREDEIQQPQALAGSRSLPHSIVQRAQIVLACGAGETNTAIAKGVARRWLPSFSVQSQRQKHHRSAEA